MIMTEIKKVHVIYKTHLDVGFTDLAKNVVDKYINSFIPKAIELAERINKDESNKKFVWTVGSWLIDEYLRRADEEGRQKIIQAINKGNIAWHGLPFTTHSELMDEELFEVGISISKDLDKRFSKNTIAAKMTDVPGHTRGIIEPLCRNNIKYLHLGVNDASHKPNVPNTFIWRDSKGNEIIVDYCEGYGKTTVIENFDEVLVFAHSGDNLGPPGEEDIYRQLARIKEQFPKAQVSASTLDAYAVALLKFKGQLPVVTAEIGDTWIHGTATDPYKVACFLELLRLKDKWAAEGSLVKQSETYKSFLRKLLMVPEHTWGLDFKKYLADYKNWRKEDFVKARELDLLSEDYIPEKYRKYGDFARKEFAAQVKHMEWKDRSYSYFESSHEEQRAYITNAIESLPACLKEEAVKAVEGLKKKPALNGNLEEIQPNKQYCISGFTVMVLQDGSIRVKTEGLKEDITFGKVGYEIFGMKTFTNWEKDYMVNLTDNGCWAVPDFFKPGIEEAGAPEENLDFNCRARKCYIDSNKIIIEAVFGDFECDEYGSPRDVILEYTFNRNEIDLCVYLYNKDASRMPEAFWVSHFVDIKRIDSISIRKLDETVNPFDVIECGNRNYHSIKEAELVIDMAKIRIIPLDSPLLSIGEKRLYSFNQNFAGQDGGLHFNLYNNLWGTNFKMWYEENIKSRFKIIIK
jgi:hypothetical protein